MKRIITVFENDKFKSHLITILNALKLILDSYKDRIVMLIKLHSDPNQSQMIDE